MQPSPGDINGYKRSITEKSLRSSKGMEVLGSLWDYRLVRAAAQRRIVNHEPRGAPGAVCSSRRTRRAHSPQSIALLTARVLLQQIAAPRLRVRSHTTRKARDCADPRMPFDTAVLCHPVVSAALRRADRPLLQSLTAETLTVYPPTPSTLSPHERELGFDSTLKRYSFVHLALYHPKRI